MAWSLAMVFGISATVGQDGGDRGLSAGRPRIGPVVVFELEDRLVAGEILARRRQQYPGHASLFWVRVVLLVPGRHTYPQRGFAAGSEAEFLLERR
jgi:hypothetical protein